MTCSSSTGSLEFETLLSVHITCVSCPDILDCFLFARDKLGVLSV